MSRLVLYIYDLFRRRPAGAWALFLLLTLLLGGLVSTLSYKEDISAFLPLDRRNQTAMGVYQLTSGADRVFAIVSPRDTSSTPSPDLLTEGVDTFTSEVEATDSLGLLSDIMATVDPDMMLAAVDSTFANLPLHLTEADYRRMDSLLALPSYLPSRLEEARRMLMFPSSNLLASTLSRDPLNLFSPLLANLGKGGMEISFDLHNGYILSPDGKRAIVVMESASGASESNRNALLLNLLSRAKEHTETAHPSLEVSLIGGPVIAVGNASRIKSDSLLAGSIAGVLILLLLIYVFRNVRNILLIAVSVGWGWLFAMGGIALFYNSVSIIVIGIASVILGIAVNYPLHLIDHLRESSRPRAALREIVAPLLVGNVTTVGAFLCLVPLNSIALHDLGLFSSLLLVGTILFVLLFLPHAVRSRREGSAPLPEPRLISALGGLKLDSKPWLVWTVLALTALFGFFSLRTEFDTDMRNINYMTPDQQKQMAYFQQLANERSDSEKLYIVASRPTARMAIKGLEAYDATVDSLVAEHLAYPLPSPGAPLLSEEKRREALRRWNDFVGRHRQLFTSALPTEAVRHGFSAEAFEPFQSLVATDFSTSAQLSEDKAVSQTLSVFPELYSVCRILSVPKANVEEVKSRLAGVSRSEESEDVVFDVASLNGSIANTLSNDFNYIGIACGCIVFLFLWLSMGRIELAIISFTPMAFSWIWILGIMGLLGMKFNIVNVILATFIFGQGDDYTIFMTEGLSYEYAYRRKLLQSYKNSIMVSALIMFIGIGTLLVARHPALRSLGEVTVVGMLSVVIMAYLFPPLMFRWIMEKRGRLRRRPVTLLSLLGVRSNAPEAVAYDRYIYKGRDIASSARRTLQALSPHIEQLKALQPSPEGFLVVDIASQGEAALLLSILHPDTEVKTVVTHSSDSHAVASGALRDFSPLLTLLPEESTPEAEALAALDRGATIILIQRAEAPSPSFKSHLTLSI